MSQREDEKGAVRAQKDSISRREFARRAALASTAAACVPTSVLATAGIGAAAPPQSSEAVKLSAESQAEVDARVQAILGRHGARLSDAQKAEVRRLTIELQKTLDTLRKANVGNGDSSALYLKPLVEREKKSAPSKSTAAEMKKH